MQRTVPGREVRFYWTTAPQRYGRIPCRVGPAVQGLFVQYRASFLQYKVESWYKVKSCSAGLVSAVQGLFLAYTVESCSGGPSHAPYSVIKPYRWSCVRVWGRVGLEHWEGEAPWVHVRKLQIFLTHFFFCAVWL